jgi:hypothetical protein
MHPKVCADQALHNPLGENQMQSFLIRGTSRLALLGAFLGMLASSVLYAQSTDAQCKCGTCAICIANQELAVSTRKAMDDVHKTGMFAGAKANTGYAMHMTVDGKQKLMLSDDFVVPDTPAPHWQVVDSNGNVYLLQRLKIKGDKYNQTIELPGYIKDVAKVQIWCSWAEALLGEASFETPVK